jgi:hypothetical protein
METANERYFCIASFYVSGMDERQSEEVELDKDLTDDFLEKFPNDYPYVGKFNCFHLYANMPAYARSGFTNLKFGKIYTRK